MSRLLNHSVSASFQEHLELALGDEYRVVRELGGGGMSRVFLATEVALGRNVVIKILTPELAAGVNRERFRREVQLAAGLQHPMIVPLLSAGEAEGLLWYTMPFVEGESLRERIQRGVLSPREALPILVDVARALGAAHRKGIVHRDIKPGNILLHENHAVVADFGVAKALSAATAGSTGLTTGGLAVGTPAYMSPEQAAGDATVDARADIYALGCVAYEMLHGKPPFTDPSMARLLVAQVSQMPVPLHQVAPVKAGLSKVVMLCLEKDPAMRWPTADALADAFEQQRYTSEPTPLPMEALPGPRTPTQPVVAVPPAAVPPAAVARSSRARLLGGGAAVVSLVALAAMISLGGKGPTPAVAFAAPQTVIVADVENRTADSTLGDLVSEALRTELQESKIVTVMTPGSIATALQRMQQSAATRVSAALAREIAVREGVPLVVEGRIQKVGSTYLVRAALIVPNDGAEQSAVQETAASEDSLIAAIGRLARRTREKLGESSASLTALPPMEDVTTNSLAALRKYTEAIRLSDGVRNRGDRNRQIELLESAVALDSNFAMAWRRLGVMLVAGESDATSARRSRGTAALTRAHALRDRLSPVERGLADAAFFALVENSPEKANAAYLTILGEQPGNRIALNNLARQALSDGNFQRLYEYGTRFVSVDSSNMAAWPWLIWGAYGSGRAAEARAIRTKMRARFSDADDVAAMDENDLWTWLGLDRDWAGMERLARTRIATAGTDTRKADELYNRLRVSLQMRGKFEEWWNVNDGRVAARLAGRDTAAARRARGDAAHERYTSRAWYLGDTAGITRAIATYVNESGVFSWAINERTSDNMVGDYVLARDAASARRRLTELRARTDARAVAGRHGPPGSMLSIPLLDAQVLLVEQKPADALRALTPLAAEARQMPQLSTLLLGEAYLAAGQRDSARVWLSLIANATDPRFGWSEYLLRHRALRTLCELADTKTRREQSCGALAEEWKDGDANVQPIVARARSRL